MFEAVKDALGISPICKRCEGSTSLKFELEGGNVYVCERPHCRALTLKFKRDGFLKFFGFDGDPRAAVEKLVAQEVHYRFEVELPEKERAAKAQGEMKKNWEHLARVGKKRTCISEGCPNHFQEIPKHIVPAMCPTCLGPTTEIQADLVLPWNFTPPPGGGKKAK